MATDDKKKTSTSKKKPTKKTPTTKSTNKKPTSKKSTSKKPITKKNTEKNKSVSAKKISKPKQSISSKTSLKKKNDNVAKTTSLKKKPVSRKKKPEPKMTEVLETVMIENSSQDEKPKKKKNKKNKVFYLILSIVFYAGVFFYLNNIMYDNEDFLKSGLFAFAALFVFFVLLQFNIHMIFINFFRLPFLYLWDQTKMEIKKEIEHNKKAEESKFPFRRYKALFTLFLYLIIAMLLVGSQIYNGIIDGDKVLIIITQSSLTLLVFLIIVCSWQYLFNILPEILDKSIDAKNGFILTLSAAVMVIYTFFNMFDIVYLAEMMIFILIVGFIALLGVNLNMIVGEINIFQNLKQRHSKTVTKVVFMIFFSFHLYVILYASVVAYSIYIWEPETYNFSYNVYEYENVPSVYNSSNELVQGVYYEDGESLTDVYDFEGNLITKFVDDDGYPITHVYNIDGTLIQEYFNELNHQYSNDTNPVFDENGIEVDIFYYNGNTLEGIIINTKTHDYADFLYYTVVTVSTLGYGDITPSTEFGIAQAWGGFLSIYGFTFFALSISFVSNIAIEGATSTREEDIDD